MLSEVIATQIDRHQEFITQHREELFDRFAPAFCYRYNERSFPMHPEPYIQDVVLAKSTYYQRQKDLTIELSALEKKEFTVIKNYFVENGRFNNDYAKYKDELDFQEVIPQKKPLSYLTTTLLAQKYEDYIARAGQLHPVEAREFKILTDYFLDDSPDILKINVIHLFDEEGKLKINLFNQMPSTFINAVTKDFLQWDDENTFLTFNEKMHGYNLGELVPYAGVNPEDKEIEPAPIFASIIPTTDGAMIKYEYFYGLSDAMPWFRWLYKCLPYSITSRYEDFGLHPGDFEGVYIKIKITDDMSSATLYSMQLFAHGRSGSREVLAANLTYQNDEFGNIRPCVFVGNGTHPSYADKFFCLSKFCDNVGDKHIIIPRKFIDLSPDQEKSEKLPPYISIFQRMGETGAMIYTGTSYVENEDEYNAISPTWHQYTPCLFSRIFSCVGGEGNGWEAEYLDKIPNIKLSGDESVL